MDWPALVARSASAAPSSISAPARAASDCPDAADYERLVCDDQDEYIIVTGPIMTGTTTGASNDTSLEIEPNCYDGEIDWGSPDVVLWLHTPGWIRVLDVDSSGSDFPAIVAVGKYDCLIPYACEDPLGTLVSAGEAGTDMYVTVDGELGTSGTFRLEIEGRIGAGEACDPAQIESGLLYCEQPTLCVSGTCQ